MPDNDWKDGGNVKDIECLFAIAYHTDEWIYFVDYDFIKGVKTSKYICDCRFFDTYDECVLYCQTINRRRPHYIADWKVLRVEIDYKLKGVKDCEPRYNR